MGKSPLPVLKTKLCSPNVAQALERTRPLRRLLDNADKAVIVVDADAGYGKTTLVAQYVRATGVQYAWYRLDASDSSVHVFLTYLAAALGVEPPDLLVQQEARSSLEETTAQAVARTLVLRLQESEEQPSILVLDDFHLVDHSVSIRLILNALLEQLPQDLQLVLLSRRAPSLLMGKLAAERRLLRVDANDLTFSLEEMRALWEHEGLFGSSASASLDLARSLTEGWPAGLALFLAWLQRGRAKEDLSLEEFGCQREVYDYLAQEVFDRQPQTIRSFLLNTAILEDIGELECGELAGIFHPKSFLKQIERENVFFRPCEGGGGRLTCHPLFRSFLLTMVQQEKGDEGVSELHRRAAEVYSTHSETERAVTHASMANDERVLLEHGARLATAVVASCRPDLAERLLQGLGCDPTDWQLMLRGYLLNCKGDYRRALDVLDDALRIAICGQDEDLIRAIVDQVTLCCAALGDYEHASETCREVLGRFERTGQRSDWAAVLMALAFCSCRVGKSDYLAVAESALEAIPEQAAIRRALACMRYALIQLVAGDLKRARLQANAGFALVKQHEVDLLSCWVATGRAEIELELGEYGTALLLIQEARQAGEECAYYRDDFVAATESLSNTLLGMGRVEEALAEASRCLQMMQHDDITTEVYCLIDSANCFRLLGNTVAACDSIDRALQLTSSRDLWLSLIARLTSSSLTATVATPFETLKALNELRDIADSAGFKRLFTWSLLLLAVARQRECSVEECEEQLREALGLASQNRYIHLMVLECRYHVPVFVHALQAGIETEFVCEILSRIGPWLLPHAEGLLASDDLRLALLATTILKDTKATWARKPLLKAVRDRRPEVAKAAAEALAALPVQQEDKLRIKALGDFKVMCGDREVMWRKRKAKHMMQYLFINRKRRLPKDVVMDTFWPESQLSASVNNFYVTFHALKRSLNPHLQRREQLPYFQASEGMVQLVQETFSSDVDEFVEAWEEARAAAAQGRKQDALENLKRCQELYVGDLMEDNLYEEWTLEERQELHETYCSAMCLLAEVLSSKGEHDEAARTLRRLINREKTREDLHLLLAAQYMLAGNRPMAHTQFKLCQRALREELDVEVSDEMRQRFECLLKSSAGEAVKT
ncbi:MAG: hypothetical protein C4521_03130 [Actinobacteria bacterium]|nr:MAG: hypothetical protein C4521_03130 [Actinomycetota bacterium]